ncbi:hypothetical protein C8J30_10620 [Rhodobacter viridis]|uniref:Uncharacterized protein n=1 Tax=Rhodobacter viridis TaxID=1054202 RepID=A0A318TZN4_9RHOB|nr:hypothetical protein [Rhodobacter viridis]PYF09888.1 hypothetical protein C8J30_10620 [Rhodobacter viridis]
MTIAARPQGCAYLWTDPAPGRAGAVAALTGLPDAATLAWCLAGPATDPCADLAATAPERSPDDARD